MNNALRLLGFTRKYRFGLTIAFICLIASTAFSLIVPDVLRQAIDGIGQGDRRFLIIAAFIVIGASIARGVFGYGNSYLTEAVSQRMAYDIRNSLYDRLQRLSFAFHDQAQTGQLMSRATEDVEAVRRFIGAGLLGFIQTGLLFIGIAVVLIVLDWRLALLTLAFLPPIGLRAVIVSRRLRRVWMKIQQLLGDLGTVLEENLTGVRVVKAFNQQPEESRKFNAGATVLYNQEITADRHMAFNIPLMVFLIGLPTAFILWYGGRRVVDGTFTVGELTQFILYVGILALPVRRLGYITNIFARSLSAGQRIFEILDSNSPVHDKPGAIALTEVKGEVRFENVSFGYRPVGAVLRNVSFTANPGEMVALVGSSGSGKSTIASLIPRFYDVTGGCITVDGTDIRDVTLASLRKNIGIVQQDIFLFSATIRENISYGAVNASLDDIIAAAKIARLHDFIQGLPQGYETMVGERGITLSGGEQQRLAIARTLLTRPRILILDDSTSSVDAETENAIRQALDRLIKGSTVFIITHRLPVIRNADLILVLKDGEIAENGRHDELMARDGIYRRIYESQLVAANPGTTGKEENDVG